MGFYRTYEELKYLLFEVLRSLQMRFYRTYEELKCV
ncbi:hypothetical protein CTHBC1_2215 [Acetivibrio thermocellus BC1]|nr:hypothetical protein CTHBC1_2215 [Acetivibrio thermocellus BC1]